jgi:hypothetical protein
MRNKNFKIIAVLILCVVLIVVLFGAESKVALGSKNANVLSAPVDLNVNLPGVVGYCVYQLGDGSIVLNAANQTCTFLEKLDPSYNLLWTQPIQIGQNSTTLPRLLVLHDGGYLLAGIVDNLYTFVKTDSQGNIQWYNTLSSGAPINYLLAISQTSDDGFVLAGFGVPVIDGLGWIWFAKTDSLGNIQWDRNISGLIYDCPSSIIQTSDGGYVLSATSYSFVPDQAFFTLIKMDAQGVVFENTTYGGYGYYYQPECNCAITTSDGGYLMAGYLWQKPAWIVKADETGTMQWNQTYGGNGSSITNALQTPNGYLLVEFSSPNCTGVIMTDDVGNQLWNTTFSDVTLPLGLEANFNSIINAEDGGYIMVASKNQSVWLAKLDYQQYSSIALHLLSVAGIAVVVTAIVMLLVGRKGRNQHQPPY